MLTSNSGRNIDETNERIEDWLEELEHASQAQGNKNLNMDDTKRQIEIKRFANSEVKDALKWLILRATLKPDIAKKVRLFEISSNEGLGLDNSEFITLVRQLEKNKGNSDEHVNKASTYGYGQTQQWRSGGSQQSRTNDSEAGNTSNGRENCLTRDEFFTKRKKLLNGCCARCGEKTRTSSHPKESCAKSAKCNHCGKSSHLSKFCVRRAAFTGGRVYAMSYDEQSENSDEEPEEPKICTISNNWDEDEDEEEEEPVSTDDSDASESDDDLDEDQIYTIAEGQDSDSDDEDSEEENEMHKSIESIPVPSNINESIPDVSPDVSPDISHTEDLDNPTDEEIKDAEEWFQNNETNEDTYEEDTDDMNWKISNSENFMPTLIL